jgi:hypothetical protein
MSVLVACSSTTDFRAPGDARRDQFLPKANTGDLTFPQGIPQRSSDAGSAGVMIAGPMRPNAAGLAYPMVTDPAPLHAGSFLCQQGFTSVGKNMSTVDLLKGEFANEYGHPVAALTI